MNRIFMSHERAHSSEISTLESLNLKLKNRFEFYQKKITELSKKGSQSNKNSFTSVKAKNLQDSLKSSLNQLEKLKREKELLLLSPDGKSQGSQLSALESKLKTLKQQNELLKSRSPEKPDPTQFIELESLKKQIIELEETHEKNQEKISQLKLSKFITTEPPNVESQPSKFQKQEQSLKSALKLNENKYKATVKELESVVEKLNSDKVCLQMKILKSTQQERLLQVSIEQGSENNSSIADASFLYKPSIKALYYN